MKINNLLDDLLDSKAKIRILRIMFRYPFREFTEREIANQIDMSPNTVNLALACLRKTNVFIYKRIGRTHSYRCNQDSVLYNILKNLFEKENEIREKLFGIIQKNMESNGSCIIFGSYARGEEEFDSDLDVLIVTSNQEKAEEMINEASAEILNRFSIVVSPMILTKKEFKLKSKRTFIKKVLEQGIHVNGKELKMPN